MKNAFDRTMITIQPSTFTLKRWADLLTPPNDVWYWHESLADIDSRDQPLLDRREYLNTYADISYVNAFWHWRMPKDVQQVLVTEPGWIGSLAETDRSRVLASQIGLDRGLIFPRSHFDHLPASLLPYAIGERIVISRAAWKSLNEVDQFTALKREMLLWDDTDCFSLPENAPNHIRQIANAYGDEHGTNCLSTTVFCVTGWEDLHRKWMHQPEFLEIIAKLEYEHILTETIEPGVVITFSDNGTVVHAAYCVAPDRFVNKNGQSMFNPVRIVNHAMLSADWADQDVAIHRQRIR